MTKIGTEVAHVTRDSDTTFKVRKSKVNLQDAGAYCGCYIRDATTSSKKSQDAVVSQSHAFALPQSNRNRIADECMGFERRSNRRRIVVVTSALALTRLNARSRTSRVQSLEPAVESLEAK